MGYPLDNTQANLYTTEGQINSYEVVSGVCILPLAEDPPTDSTELASWSPVVVLRLHAPYRIRRYSHTSDKKNNPPPIPSLADQGKFIFVEGTIDITNNLNSSFCNFDWSCTCNYTFVEDCVSREQDGYMLGNPTFQWRSSTINSQSGYSLPSFGAVAHAGLDGVVGYTQGINIVGNQVTGALKEIWGYNTPSYFPGTLVLSEMVNCGTPIVPVS